LSDELDEVPPESLAVKAREEIDKLRSVQLYAELRVAREVIEALRESAKEVRKRAIQLARVHLEDFMEGQKTPRQWGFRIGKWEALIIITIIIAVVVFAVLGKAGVVTR